MSAARRVTWTRLLDHGAMTGAQLRHVVDELTSAGSIGRFRNPDGRWSYVDDRGTRVELPRRPRRIAFLADSVGATLWIAGLRPVAASHSHGRPDLAAAVGMDLTGVARLGCGDAERDLALLISTRPELLVDAVQPDGALQTASTSPRLAQVAPIVGVNMHLPAGDVVGQAARLGEALGMTPADASAKVAYERATHALRSAVAANPTPRVGFVSDASTVGLAVMDPDTSPVLQTVRSLGIRLAPIHTFSANRTIDWGAAASISADLLVCLGTGPLPTNAPWQQIPAVRAGQVCRPDIASCVAYGYAPTASLLDSLAAQVATARLLTHE
jgi:iron complex transport system substrate-binding protein